MEAFSVVAGRFFAKRSRAAAYVLVTSPLGVAAGLWAGPWALPVLQGLFFFPLFLQRLIERRSGSAVRWALCWAAFNAVIVIVLSGHFPAEMAPRILMAAAYREEMFAWIVTGVGRESDIRRFLPQHLLHLGLFSLLTLFSAGLLGLMMGAVLLDYMSYYVGALMHEAGSLTLALMAWPPWAVLRVAGFICVASVLAGWSLVAAGRRRPEGIRRLLWIGLVLLFLDIVLKWALAPMWRHWLFELAGPSLS